MCFPFQFNCVSLHEGWKCLLANYPLISSSLIVYPFMRDLQCLLTNYPLISSVFPLQLNRASLPEGWQSLLTSYPLISSVFSLQLNRVSLHEERQFIRRRRERSEDHRISQADCHCVERRQWTFIFTQQGVRKRVLM